MAKSIYEILDDLTVETSVPRVKDKDDNIIRKNFGDVKHTIPRTALPTSEQFEDETKLYQWAKDAGVLHACLQTGIQKRIIDIRAIFKSMKKDETWTPEVGQAKVDTAKWTIVKRPKTKVDEAFENGLKAAKAMASLGDAVTDEMIHVTVAAICPDRVAEIMDLIKIAE